MESRHLTHMRQAVKLAKYALDHNETPVACIFVYEPTDEIIAYGMNDTNKSHTGIAHAEFMGIDQIQEKFGAENLVEIFKDTVLYVTVEPCIMCASALKQLGIKRVYFGCGNERFGGNGTVLTINKDHSTISLNENKTYDAIPGIYRKEAIMLLRYFYVRENDHAPKPKVKKERILDKETFPPIIWSSYIDRSLFGQEFGLENLVHFDENTDLAGISNHGIDWKLIDDSCDDIVDTLEITRQKAQINIHKRIKSTK
ncbi:similar to Saccharomyces cerevisiae YJL035C TAD2 Subunit of tRNA-specific adenosine-34 deaminase [Maudiozyma saulgeensis]|uniref:tRNA(adenine(34)) deaminase n=1 Tax=Maudiozyma saulgeensis TaxID=1789683 RepID=A0A1X7R5Q0_9SACH|nr:similar to Saccharomyces cerevisiae YJL035C TAD2 Subunit of tRNA-specific adenosine-34 deaminase [Kazachstania saulgeensis]